MAPRKRTQSQISGNTDSPTPKRKSRGKAMKIKKEVASSSVSTISSSDADDLNSLASNDRESSESSKSYFPFEDVRLMSTLEGTIKAVQEGVTNILDDHVLRCTIPIEKMAYICQILLKKLADRKIERGKKSIPLLEGTIDEAFAEFSEGAVDINKSIFRLELSKYILIAASKFDSLSTEVLLSVVANLQTNGLNMSDYEAGCPARVSSTIETFYGLTKGEFMMRSMHDKLKMEIEYVREKLRWTKDMSKYLNQKHQKYIKLEKLRNGDSNNPPKDRLEDRAKEDELVEAFKRNSNTERNLKMEYERLISEQDMAFSPYREAFRTKMLNGKTGVRSEQEEIDIQRKFAQTPLSVIMLWIDEDLENVELRTPDEPSKRNKADPLEYKHRFIATPAIHLMHDPL